MSWGKEWLKPLSRAEMEQCFALAKEFPIPSSKELKPQGSNLVDAEAYLYFQCESCQKILDPQTKSFAILNQKRFGVGWLVKWNVDGMGYKVYCVDCGKKKG